MICFGMGVNNQVVLSEESNGTWLSINMAWGIAVLMGVYCSEGVGGAHLNCAVSFAHAVYGRLPWWKLPGYCVSQVVGSVAPIYIEKLIGISCRAIILIVQC
uniref:Aquaporin n=1 Tax=Phytophthora fragariae TaxID=53985 RepID=A0A6A3DTW0_9STRA|nr:hypothetical protein PF009_g24743 [Phytophthora fragariae]